MGAHFIKAQKRHREADEEKQIKFAQNFSYVAVNYGFAKILFADEMLVSTSAHNDYGWTFNQRLIVKAR